MIPLVALAVLAAGLFCLYQADRPRAAFPLEARLIGALLLVLAGAILTGNPA